MDASTLAHVLFVALWIDHHVRGLRRPDEPARREVEEALAALRRRTGGVLDPYSLLAVVVACGLLLAASELADGLGAGSATSPWFGGAFVALHSIELAWAVARVRQGRERDAAYRRAGESAR